MKKSSRRDCAEEIKTSSVKQKVGKKRRRDECGVEGSVVTSETLAEKKRVKKKSSSSHVAERGKQELSKEEVERQLLKISATPHTRLLVSPDSEQLWFDQVRSSLVPHYYYNFILGSTYLVSVYDHTVCECRSSILGVRGYSCPSQLCSTRNNEDRDTAF